MKKFISFSGGVESTTMCILFGEGATAIFCDTGAEHNKLLDRINVVADYCKTIHKDFELVIIKPSVKVKSVIVDSLLDSVILQRFMPSQQARYCTRQFKIEPIDKFLKEAGDCELMIGLNADEYHIREGNKEMMQNVTYTYPLYEAGLTREDCEDVLNQHGMHPNFPPYMTRGGCKMCFFKTRKEYKAMYVFEPAEFEEVVKFENDYQDKRKKFYSIMGNGESLQNIKNEVDSEISLWGLEQVKQMYSTIVDKKSCGLFCKR